MSDKDEDGFIGFLEELIKSDCLESAALGITKKVIADGVSSLSPKQLYVFEKNVLDEFTQKKCSSCFGNIPWSEMSLAYDNGWKCSYCVHRFQKMEDE